MVVWGSTRSSTFDLDWHSQRHSWRAVASATNGAPRNIHTRSYWHIVFWEFLDSNQKSAASKQIPFRFSDGSVIVCIRDAGRKAFAKSIAPDYDRGSTHLARLPVGLSYRRVSSHRKQRTAPNGRSDRSALSSDSGYCEARCPL